MQPNEESIVQLRGFVSAGSINILNAMHMHKDNPQLCHFIEAFEIINGGFTKPDDDEIENILNDDGEC